MRRYTVVIWSYLRRTCRRFLELEALLDLWKGHKSSIVPFATSIISIVSHAKHIFSLASKVYVVQGEPV